MIDKDFELNGLEISFPETYKTAGLFVQIDDCEEVCVMTKHSEAETIAEPFTIEFKAIKIPEGFQGKYNHCQIVLPNGKSVKMTYKVID